MDINAQLEKLKANRKKIQEFQEKRDFTRLIDIYEESLMLDNSLGNNWERLPQISYCYIRLNDFDKAKQVLEKYGSLSLSADQAEVYRATMLLGLFLQFGGNDFVEEMINSTLASWLNDPEAVDQTKSIVFDYRDYF